MCTTGHRAHYALQVPLGTLGTGGFTGLGSGARDGDVVTIAPGNPDAGHDDRHRRHERGKEPFHGIRSQRREIVAEDSDQCN